ncbi:MAG TPA: glucose 1-dehydrogenase [Robiginitalea sp.]|nr:glucose 1-dehydrogenase [Robiginitalea sp.]
MFRLDAKTALVTGGGKGIGQAISELFAKQGARVYILDVDEKGAAETIRRIQEAGGSGFFEPCDVTRPDQVREAVDSIASASGGIDIVVNNAGIAHIGTAESTTPDDMDRLLEVNVKGVFHVLRATLPYLKEKGGSVLNLASVAAFVGLNDRFAYSATKGAVATMTLSVAKDYLPFGIRCNSISPGRVHTPFVDGFLKQNYPGRESEMFEKLSRTQPIGRMAEPEEIACLALYLCSDEASFITGSDFPIDGGFKTLNT